MQRIIVALCLTIAFTSLDVNAIICAEAPEQSIQSLLTEARAAETRGDFASASSWYRKATKLEPGNAELWADLGLMDYQIGKSSEAIQSFKQAIHLNPHLFVPQLFLGIEYLSAKNPARALTYLQSAKRLRPGDLQTLLSLGYAYEMLGRADSAVETYLRATKIAPQNGNAWLDLGTAYLKQVQNDARVMTSAYRHSGDVALRAAETLADEGSLNAAENWYREAIASPSPLPCAHAEFGITLLHLGQVPEAETQFRLERRTGSPCGLARLGVAIAAVAEGHPDVGLAELTSIAKADPAFVQSSLPLFQGVLSAHQLESLINLAPKQQNVESRSINIVSVIDHALGPGATSITPMRGESSVSQTSYSRTPQSAARFYGTGQYTRCTDALKPAIAKLNAAQQRMLAACSFYVGDFQTTTMAAARLKTDPATRLKGLYWQSKADERLAVAALARAGEIEPNSARMHVLIGNVFRQKRNWSEAEVEYRRAIDLDPKSHAARLSLAIVLFTELKTKEALTLDQSLLKENPEDPEANLLAGDIFVQGHHFEQAEPYLSRCKNLESDLIPRLHILLGQVYAATNRASKAISEYKLGLISARDEDGKFHYQLARLYQKSGNIEAAKEEFRLSQRLRESWDKQAKIDLGQLSADRGQP